MSKLKLAVLISGNGSNLESVINKCACGELDAEVAVVISNKSDAFGLKRAQKAGIEHFYFHLDNFTSRQEYEKQVISLLQKYEIDLVVLAGYMLLVGEDFVKVFENKIINLHPSLLPNFPGAEAIGDALKNGAKVTGVTVHFVDKNLDTGPIILQQEIEIKENDTYESLAERIHKAEHELLPKVIQLFAESKIELKGNKVLIKE